MQIQESQPPCYLRRPTNHFQPSLFISVILLYHIVEEQLLLAWAGGEPPTRPSCGWRTRWTTGWEPKLEEGPISNLDLEEETGDK
ncbi:MAG: hypothetical protein GY696_39820 [Gammaproteobacteria bacterium]|nr:hypothetical protein [Gammaproteobacteria bacterium]